MKNFKPMIGILTLTSLILLSGCNQNLPVRQIGQQGAPIFPQGETAPNQNTVQSVPAETTRPVAAPQQPITTTPPTPRQTTQTAPARTTSVSSTPRQTQSATPASPARTTEQRERRLAPVEVKQEEFNPIYIDPI